MLNDVDRLYAESLEKQKALLEQYKLYLELADRISARRMLSNTFFLSVNSALAGGVFLSLEKLKSIEPFFTIAFFIVCIAFCMVWWLIVHSYRQLNSGKFKVVHEMENLLPYSCFHREWNHLGRGNIS